MAKRRNISGRTLRQASPTNVTPADLAGNLVLPRTYNEGFSISNIFGDIGDAIHPGITAKIENDLGLRNYTDEEIQLLFALGVLPFASKIAKAGINGVKALNKASRLPAKGGFIMANPGRPNKSAERSMFTPKDPNKKPVELSHKALEADDNITNTLKEHNDWMDQDDTYYGGPGIIDYESLPYDNYKIGQSELVNFPELKEYFDNPWDGSGYNSTIGEWSMDDNEDVLKYLLDDEEVQKGDDLATKLKQIFGNADANDIIIGDGAGEIMSRSAQDLAKSIDNGKLVVDADELQELLNGNITAEEFLKNYIDNYDYSITQKDFDNLLKTYSRDDMVKAIDPQVSNIIQQMKAQIKSNPEAKNDIIDAYKEQLRTLREINELD